MKKKFSLLMPLVLLNFLFITFNIFTATQKKDNVNTVYIIPVHGEIDKALMVFIRRGIDEAKKNNAKYIILDIDTFGGRVDSALQITTIVGSAAPIETIAFVTTGPDSKGVSWSAGALISFACNKIYMASGTSIGAAAPVIQTQEGMQPASEKIVSAVRAQMAALAEKNGYSKSVVKAMVDEDIELIEIYIDGKLIVIDAEEYKDYERSARKKSQVIEKGKIVSKSGKLLTMTALEMEKYGLSSGTVTNQEQLYNILKADKKITIEKTTSDELVALITGSILVSMLIMIGMIMLYVEITSPGFGIPGTVAIICFAVVFSSNALLGKVGSLELLLFIAGIILLIIEIFIIPGFGITGITGIILIALSLVFSLQDFVLPEFDWQWDIFIRNITTIGVSLVLSFIGIIIIANIIPRSGLFRRLALNTTQTAESGYVVETQVEKNHLIGLEGVAVTILRPAGKAEINNEIYEVESDGEYIKKGTNIKIIEVSGNRIIVRKK